MKRNISLILASMLLIGSVPAYGTISAAEVSYEAPVSAAAAFEFTDVVINLGADETEMNFVWYQNDSTPGTLLLAKAEDIEGGVMPDDAKRFICTSTPTESGYYSNRVTATELEPDTEYAYQPTCGENADEIYYFTTDGEGDFSFIYVGDPQVSNSSSHRTKWATSLEFMENSEIFDDVAFLLSAGDQVNGSAGQDEAGYEGEYDVYLDHDFMRGMPSVNVIGNHDVAARFKYHFYYPNESTDKNTQTTAGNNSYFLYNDVLFINVNGNVQAANKMASQRSFIKSACEAYPNAKWKVVITHQSMYGVAYHATEKYILDMRQSYIPMYDEFDIDVVLQGHDHVYCRTYLMKNFEALEDVSYYDDATYSSATDTDGILYITANSGTGTKHYDIAYPSGILPFVAVQNQEHMPNVSKVYVSDNEFSITTYRTTDASIVDTFTIYKKAENVERLINLIDAEITLLSEDAILAARDAYDELTEEQQDNVSNYDVLVAAEEALDDIKSHLPDTEVGLYIENAPESVAVGDKFTVDVVAYSSSVEDNAVTAVNFTLDYDAELLSLESIVPAESIGGYCERNGGNYAWMFDTEEGGAAVGYQDPIKLAEATFVLNSSPDTGKVKIGFDEESLLNIALADDALQQGFTPDVKGVEIAVATGKITFITAEKYRALAADQKIVAVAAEGGNTASYIIDYGNGDTEPLYYSSRYNKYVAIVDKDMSEADIASAIKRVFGTSDELKYNGDVNCDGRITAGDAALVSDILHSYTHNSKAADKAHYSDRMRLEADVNGVYSEDGDYVTVTDAMRVLYWSVGLR